MITSKKLQVAAAVASLFAVGVTHAATVNSSGAIVAAETVFSTFPKGADTRVRAPEFTYQYEGGVSVGASSEQRFAIVTTLGGGVAQWATSASAATPGAQVDPLTENALIGAGTLLARTIQAMATVNGFTGRVAVVGASEPQPAGAVFYIRLDTVEVGNKIVGSPDAASPLSLTFKFTLVNRTPANVALQQLAMSFNTSKVAGASLLALFGAAPETATGTNTDSRNRYLHIWRLHTLSADTTSCVAVPPAEWLRLTVNSAINEPPVPSSEEELNNTGTSRVTINNYLNLRRALDISLGKAADRQIQVTNSFPTNLGATPVNGWGGTGGGRYSFRPTTTTVTPNYGSGTNGFINVGPVGDGNATLDNIGTFPVRTTSGDERGASIGSVTFGAHPTSAGLTTLDRQLDVDAYQFTPELLGGAQGVAADSSVNPSAAGRNGDFSVNTLVGGGAVANVFGGVDVPNGAATGLTITFDSKPGFAGFAKGALAGQVSMVAPGGTCATAFPAVAAGTTMLGTLTEPVAGSGNYRWTFTGTELATAAAAGTNPGTLRGTWTVCYAVDGVTQIPATFFKNVVVSLGKDDPTEQANNSCPGNFANVFGGVKVDVRNFQMTGVLGVDPAWQGILRVINNSETETATVDAQYIHNSGAYGKWGTIATLAPRAATYVMDTDILAKLTNPTTAVGVPVNNAGPAAGTDNTIRIRVSADVSTIRVQNYVYNSKTGALTEVSSSQGADFVNVDSSNRDHIDQDAQTDIKK